jgi:hypothetical protein
MQRRAGCAALRGQTGRSTETRQVPRNDNLLIAKDDEEISDFPLEHGIPRVAEQKTPILCKQLYLERVAKWRFT